MYGNTFFFANHIWDADLRWEAKTNFTKVVAEGGDDEEEEDDDE